MLIVGGSDVGGGAKWWRGGWHAKIRTKSTYRWPSAQNYFFNCLLKILTNFFMKENYTSWMCLRCQRTKIVKNGEIYWNKTCKDSIYKPVNISLTFDMSPKELSDAVTSHTDQVVFSILLNFVGFIPAWLRGEDFYKVVTITISKSPLVNEIFINIITLLRYSQLKRQGYIYLHNGYWSRGECR